MSPSAERREFQRLRLPVVIEGFLGDTPVEIAEIGVLSARIRHRLPLMPGSQGALRFIWDGKDLELLCMIARSSAEPAGAGFQSGVRLLGATGSSDARLRELLTSSVAREIELRGKGGLSEPPFDPDGLVRAKLAPFICFRLDAGGWVQTRTFLPDQPDAGFTVAAGEDDDELALLRRTYAQADTQGRELVRLFAELSVTEKSGIPPRRD